MVAILSGEGGIPPKGRWIGAAVVADEGVHGVRGIMSMEITPQVQVMRYVIFHESSLIISAWQSFEEAGNPYKRLEIQIVKGVDPEKFLQDFAKLYGAEYVRLQHRGGAGFKCFHLAPVPDELLKPPALMGFGGACSVYGGAYRPRSGGQNGVLLGP